MITTSAVTAPTPFRDLDEYIALPRLGGWYTTVLAFLDTTIRGAPWSVPDALR